MLSVLFFLVFFFKQKTAYEMRISDWSSDVCSSDLIARKELSAAEVLEAAIARIEARNPALNAVVHAQFDTARAAVKAGLPAGPLHGVQIGRASCRERVCQYV